MNTQKLINRALNKVDILGFQLDSMGITSKVNRHNLAAFIMHEQKHLEGQWDSLQVRFDRKKMQLEETFRSLESHAETFVSPVIARVTQLRTSSRS